jgi:sigma-B regulation protein RsbU (phosphoserine phosphatase)
VPPPDRNTPAEPNIGSRSLLDVLVAEDEPVSRHLLEKSLRQWGYHPIVCPDGLEALGLLRSANAPRIAVLDWVMPGMDGVDICRAIRDNATATQPYLILLTARVRPEDIVEGLRAGADDYITKPVDREEFEARLQVASRIVGLQQRLSDRVSELEEALTRVRQLHGLLPICAYCKRIRDDQNYWNQVETYIAEHTDVQFSHGICPSCFERVMKDETPDTTPHE